MSEQCIYNKKALKFFPCAVCYYCLSSFNPEELNNEKGEDLVCPECEQQTVIPVNDDDELTMTWIGEMTLKFFKFEGV